MRSMRPGPGSSRAAFARLAGLALLVAALSARAASGGEPPAMRIADTIRSFSEIIEGKHDDLPEQAFLMVGSIDDAREAGEKMLAKDA